MRKFILFFVLSLYLLAFQRVKLTSGTVVIYQEDGSYPLVSVAIGIEAGSAYEAPAERGLSHFLEHMLFDGTFRRDRDSLEKSFADIGTYYNAFTRKDYVVFEFVAPPSALSEAFQLMGEMLFLSSFPEGEFQKEKKVVYQEILKDYANPASSSAYEFYRRFLRASPYAEPVLGYPQVIKNLRRQEVMDFWARHYAPSRMRVVIIGDFSFKEIKPELERLFSFPRKGVDAEIKKVLPLWGRVESIQGPVRRLDLAFRAPSPCKEGSGPYEILAEVLSSRLRRLLSLPRLSAEYEKHRGVSFLHFSSLLRKSVDPKKIPDLLSAALSWPISRRELSSARNSYFSSRIMLLEKKIHLAREVAGWEVLCPGRWEAFLMEVKKAGLKELEEARKQVERAKNEGKYYALLQGPEFKKELFKAISPEITSSRLPNGLRYALFSAMGQVHAAHLLVGKRPWLEDFPGQLHLLMKTLEKQTEEKARGLGLTVQFTDYPFFPFDDFYLSKDYAYIRMEGYSPRRLEEFLCDALNLPLSPGAFEKAKEEVLWELGYLQSRASWMAEERLRASLFIPPLSCPLYGDRKLITSANLEGLKRLRRRAFSPSNLVYTASWPSLPPCLKNLRNRGGRPSRIRTQGQEDLSRPKRASYGLGWKFKWEVRDYPSYLLLAWALRDALVEEVREKRGLAYSVEVSFIPYSNGEGWLRIIIPTDKGSVEKVREAVGKVLSAFSPAALNPREFRRLKISLASRILRYGERKINRAYYTGLYLYLGFSPDYLFKLPFLIEKLKKDRLTRAWMSLRAPAEVLVK